MPGMTRGGSIQIGRIFGIRIGVTVSWLVVLFFLIFSLSGYFRDAVTGASATTGYLVAVASAFLFYASIVLHELGHALVARRFGIEVERIDLWFFGGVTALGQGETRTPWAEFAIAVAGPAVTAVVLAATAGAATALDSGSHFVDVATLQAASAGSAGYVLLSFLASMNAILLAFNLLPGFPLDGGRMAMAIAWKVTGDRNRGMQFAGRAGQVVAYGLGAFGLWLLVARNDPVDGIWMLLLAWMLVGAARAATLGAGFQRRLQAVQVADVMDPHPVTLPAHTTLLQAHDEVFERHGWPFVAVIDDYGRFLGVLRREAVEQELAAGRPALSAAEAVDPDPAPFAVHDDQPLEAALTAAALRTIGAVFVVDAHGLLRGVVTADQVRRALAAAPGRAAGLR